ncbi:MAG: DNA polymerase III subunit beta [Ignavibacteria bacterium]|nr:DNA polymerase III subunit beta [Ignavibacteria bacterium]
MEFKINTKELEKQLNKVVSIVPSRSNMLILEHFLMTVRNNVLSMYSTDLHVSLQNSIPISASSDFSVAIPAKLLFDTIKTLEDTDIKIKIDSDHKVKVTTDTGIFVTSYLDAIDYPTIPELDALHSFAIDGKKLKYAFDTIGFAASKEEIRIAMTGVLLELKKEEIVFVSTDGHRLAKLSLLNYENPVERRIVIPSKSVSILTRLLEDQEVKISFSDTLIKFEFGNEIFVSKLIDDPYPNYESVIPLENDNILEISKDSLLKVLRRIALFTSTSTKQVRFGITKDILSLSAENIDFGSEALEKVLCEYNGTPMEIAFNSSYITEILSNIPHERVIFRLNNPTRACIVEPKEQNENENLIMLIMPMRINV